MAGYSGDPGDFALSMQNMRVRGKFTEVTLKAPRLRSNTQPVTVKVGGITTGNRGHDAIMYLDENLSNKSITTSKLTKKTFFYSVCVREDKLIISGGLHDELKKSVADVHQFCFTSKKWEELNAMLRPRDRHNSACINDSLIILAGVYTEDGTIKRFYQDVHTLDLRTGAWTAQKECPIGVELASIAVVDDTLFLIGGRKESYWYHLFGNESYKTYKFSLHDNKWTMCSDIPAFRQFAVNSTVATQQSIYVLAFKDFYVYDVPRNQWSTLSAPLVPSYWCSLVPKDNTLVMMGGTEGNLKNPHKRIQCYDLRTKEWSLISDTLPLPLAFHTVVIMEL